MKLLNLSVALFIFTFRTLSFGEQVQPSNVIYLVDIDDAYFSEANRQGFVHFGIDAVESRQASSRHIWGIRKLDDQRLEKILLSTLYLNRSFDFAGKLFGRDILSEPAVTDDAISASEGSQSRKFQLTTYRDGGSGTLVRLHPETLTPIEKWEDRLFREFVTLLDSAPQRENGLGTTQYAIKRAPLGDPFQFELWVYSFDNDGYLRGRPKQQLFLPAELVKKRVVAPGRVLWLGHPRQAQGSTHTEIDILSRKVTAGDQAYGEYRLREIDPALFVVLGLDYRPRCVEL